MAAGARMNHGKRYACGWSLLFAFTVICSAHAQRATGNARSDPGIVPTQFGKDVDHDVEAVRAATASFKVLDNAVAAGYEREVARCITNPSVGGMGFHHRKLALRDGTLEVDKPEILLYARTPDGQYSLTGVEYIVPVAAWSRSEPPAIMGQTLIRDDSLGIWYLHAWIWQANPLGLFANWNPHVTCHAHG